MTATRGGAVDTIVGWLIGGAAALFLLIAVAESVWWPHTHSHRAAVTALGYLGYTAGTFALISVLFWLKDKLAGWPGCRRHRTALHQIARLSLNAWTFKQGFGLGEPPIRAENCGTARIAARSQTITDRK